MTTNLVDQKKFNIATLEKSYNPKDNTYVYSMNLTISTSMPTTGYIDEYSIFLDLKNGAIDAIDHTHAYRIVDKGALPMPSTNREKNTSYDEEVSFL